MADSKADLLAGAGGLVTEESQTHHEGRKALLLVRNNEDCAEFIALAKTMGIRIVERVEQRGIDDPKWFMGQGKLQDIAEELALPPVKIHCSVLAEDAITAAIEDYKNKAK